MWMNQNLWGNCWVKIKIAEIYHALIQVSDNFRIEMEKKFKTFHFVFHKSKPEYMLSGFFSIVWFHCNNNKVYIMNEIIRWQNFLNIKKYVSDSFSSSTLESSSSKNRTVVEFFPRQINNYFLQWNFECKYYILCVVFTSICVYLTLFIFNKKMWMKRVLSLVCSPSEANSFWSILS